MTFLPRSDTPVPSVRSGSEGNPGNGKERERGGEKEGSDVKRDSYSFPTVTRNEQLLLRTLIFNRLETCLHWYL